MNRIGLVWKSLEVILFETPLSKAHLRVGWLCVAAIYLVGIAHWIWFFNRGDLNLVSYDWVLQGAFLNTLRDSQINGIIPWRWNEPFYHTADFLANAEVVLTPDIIALRWLSNSSFVILHTIVLYSCGFIGSMLIVRKYDSGLTTFVFFWLLFNFNGYLTSHLSVGHFAWLGYFILPFFFLLMFRFIQDSHSASSLSVTSALSMAFLLGALFLNGSVHVAVWCSIFMVITVCWRHTMFLNVLVSIIVGGLLAANRLLPAAIFFPPIKEFVLGYATFSDLLNAFTSLRNHDFIPFGTIYTHGEGWWEYDIFIGFIAFVVLSLCLVPALKLAKLENQLALFLQQESFYCFR